MTMKKDRMVKSNPAIEAEREILLTLRQQPNVNKKLIDLALKSDAPRLSVDEINKSLGREGTRQ